MGKMPTQTEFDEAFGIDASSNTPKPWNTTKALLAVLELCAPHIHDFEVMDMLSVAWSAAKQRSRGERAGVEVTPEMVRAGVAAFRSYDPEGDSSEEIVKEILEAALAKARLARR